MEVLTRDFGKIEVKKENVIRFPQAVPGFPEAENFVLFPLAEESPFIVMQSTDNQQLAFITIEPGKFFQDYEFEISDSAAQKLKIEDNEDVLVLSIATIKDDIQNMTVNLAAPVIINLQENLGKQIILDEDKYPVKYRLFASGKKEMIK